MNKVNIITYNCKSCSGFCAYCNARIEDLISQGFDLNNLMKSLDDINKKNYEESKWDFEKLEDKLIKHPLCKGKEVQVTLWGADPLGSFDCLQENVDFLKYMEEKYEKKFYVGFCTNGLGLFKEDWVEYLIKENIHFSLSHDGLGQEIRTIKEEFNPLISSGWDEVCKNKLCGLISPVLNQYNSNPIDNFEYFREKVFDKYPFIKLRLSKSKNGLYDVKAVNKNGLCNGKYYEELKGKEYGDMLIHNDYDNPLLSSQLDIYLENLKKMYDKLSSYPNAAEQLIHMARLNNGDKEKNYCYKYQNGLTPFSATIDTMGNDCDCMLMDSQVKARIKGMADYCSDCPYKGRYECKECNVMEFPKESKYNSHKCEFNYRYQNLMDYANARIDLYEIRSRQVTRSRQNASKRLNVSKGCRK